MKRFFATAMAAVIAAGLWSSSSFAVTAADALASMDAVNTVTAGDRGYLAEIQSAVAKDDKKWLADQVLPGASVAEIKGDDVTLESGQQFLDNYAAILTPEVRKQIAGLTVQDLSRSWKGVAAGFVLSFDRMAPMDTKTGKQTEPMRYRISGFGLVRDTKAD